MKGDFTRNTFKPGRHYTGVLKQQGRVDLDADWNEQVGIQQRRTHTGARDVIGPAGAPKMPFPGSAGRGSFQLYFDSGKVMITRGRFYVEGLQCELESEVAYDAQPDFPAAPLPQAAGARWFFYLDAWQRHMTFVEDPDLREPALGGADTATRLRAIWQVKAVAIPQGANVTCAGGWQGLLPPAPDDTLSARVEPEQGAGADCSLTPTGGYHGLENRLYRVEIHDGGPFESNAALAGAARTLSVSDWAPGGLPWRVGQAVLVVTNQRPAGLAGRISAVDGGAKTVQVDSDLAPLAGNTGIRLRRLATFKWSRENGSTVYPCAPVVPSGGGGANPRLVQLGEMPRDGVLAIRRGDWVEVSGDRDDLLSQPGTLTRVDDLDPSGLQLTLAADVSVHFGQGHLKVRRWDQAGPAIAVAAAAEVYLEQGLRVTLNGTRFVTGDYWAIPARAATAEGSAGQIEPRSSAPREGIHHFYAPLGLLTWQAAGTNALTAQIEDCRPVFPALTELEAEDVRYNNDRCNLPGVETVQDALDALCSRLNPCNFVVEPGMDIQALIDSLPARADASFCFRAGLYPLTRALVFKNLNSLKLTGAGGGTLLSAARTEAVLVFDHCRSVLIRDLAVETHPRGTGDKHINGALSFISCGEVNLEQVRARANTGSRLICAGVTVRPADKEAVGARSVLIRDSRVEAGDEQVGILLVDVLRSTLENCRVDVLERAGKIDMQKMLQDRRFRARLRKVMVSDLKIAQVARADGGGLMEAVRPGVRPAFRPSPLILRPPLPGIALPGGATPAADAAGAANAPAGAPAGTPAGAANAPAAGQGGEGIKVVSTGNTGVMLGDLAVTFNTATMLRKVWPYVVQTLHAGSVSAANPAAAIKALYKTVDKILLDPEFRKRFAAIRAWFDNLPNLVAAAGSQGIVVGGRQAQEVRILNCTVSGFWEGIHIGLSHREAAPSAPDMAGAVTLRGNRVVTRLTFDALHQGRHAVFVGNTQSLLAEDNRLELDRRPGAEKFAVQGLVAFGFFGPRLLLQRNTTQGFGVGVVVTPRTRPNQPIPDKRLWLVNENVALDARTPVQAPATVTQRDNI